MPIPREHGAWGMLYMPFLLAVAVIGKVNLQILILLIAITAIFFAHEPLVRIARIKTRTPEAIQRKKDCLQWFVLYLITAGLAAVPLLLIYHLWLLMIAGALMLLLLGIHFQFLLKHSERSILAELAGVLSLTSTAAVVVYVISARITRTGLVLWLLCSIYFVSSIFYVKAVVSRSSRKQDAKRDVLRCLCYHAAFPLILLFLVRAGLIPAVVLLAFLPPLIRSVWSLTFPARKLNLRKVGFAEFGYTFIFFMIVSFAFHS